MPFRTIFFAICLVIKSVCSFSQNCNDDFYSGDGTYYQGVDGTSNGNCSLPVGVGDYYHCAMNNSQYNGSDACGAFIRVYGPKGAITLRVVDRCPECHYGDIDMTEQAFSEIADVIDGRVPITWRFIPANHTESIHVNFKEGSSQFWTAIQFRNIEHAIISMEYQKPDLSWQLTERALFNFFIEPEGIPSPMNLRITSILGEQLILENIVLNVNQDYNTGLQFTTPTDCLDPLGTPNFSFDPVSVFPNPTTNGITISGDFGQWVLSDVNGRQLLNGTSDKIDLAFFQKGLYFILVNNQAIKIIKE